MSSPFAHEHLRPAVTIGPVYVTVCEEDLSLPPTTFSGIVHLHPPQARAPPPRCYLATFESTTARLSFVCISGEPSSPRWARPTVSPAHASPLRRAKLEGSRLQLELFQIGLGMQQRDSQYVRARVENGAKSARQLAVLTFFVCVYGG